MEAVGNIFYLNWELPFMAWFQSVVTWPPLMWLLNNLSIFGESMLMIAIMGIFYWGLDKQKGKNIGLAIILASLFNPMIKNIFLRLRPYFCSDKVQLLRKIDQDADIYNVAAQGYSFPSGHSSGAASAYGSLAAVQKKKGYYLLAVLLCLFTGISRVYVGAHFPTDVICGWLLGILVVLLVMKLIARSKNTVLVYGILLLAGLPGFFYCKSDDFYTAYGMLLGACAGFMFEAKFVNFENTKKPLAVIIRLVVGAALYFGLNTALKLPFPNELLDSATTAAFLIRTLRYALVIFFISGIYPMSFKLFKGRQEKHPDDKPAEAE